MHHVCFSTERHKKKKNFLKLNLSPRFRRVFSDIWTRPTKKGLYDGTAYQVDTKPQTSIWRVIGTPSRFLSGKLLLWNVDLGHSISRHHGLTMYVGIHRRTPLTRTLHLMAYYYKCKQLRAISFWYRRRFTMSFCDGSAFGRWPQFWITVFILLKRGPSSEFRDAVHSATFDFYGNARSWV